MLAFNGAGSAQQYSFRQYGAAEGLQNLTILSLAQDGTGYMWAGSESGLYRYDGTRFRLMGAAEGLPCVTEVHALHVAADGALWVNTCARVFRFDGQRFHPVAGLNGMMSGAQSMTNDARGRVLVATPSGLYEAAPNGDGSFSARPYSLGRGLAGVPLRAIARNGSQLWFGCRRSLCVEDRGRVTTFGPAEGLPEDAWDAIAIAPDGSVWTRSPSRLYRKPPGATRLVQEKPDIASSVFWGVLTAGRDGSVIVPTDKGLAIRREGTWSVIDERRGLRNAMTSAVLEDRDGSLWIALIGAGVARWLGYGEWEAWTKAQGLPSDLIWSIRRDRKGALWVGTSMGLVRLDGRVPPRTWTRKDGLGGDNVRWLGETSDGAVWAVVKPGSVARIDPATGKIRLFGEADGLSCATSHRGFVDHLDRLWVATACGVFRNDRPSASGRFRRIDQPASLEHAAWAFAEDKQGTMWTTNPDGLWRLSEGRWRQYRKADGLLNDNPYITTIGPDGALWLHHRFDADIERVELSGDRIVRSTPVAITDASLVEVTAFHGFDALGRLWRGGANGVSVLADGFWRKLSTEDGLIWNDTDGEAFWADADGSVWIGTSGGLAHYRPPRGGATGAPVADPIITALEIGQNSRVITAEFSSLNFKSEQLVRFRYRLDGVRWTDTAQRIISIAGLAPGRHRLEIQSRVRDGPVSPKVAVAEFQIEPEWWETWWLRSAAVLLGAAAVWGVILWRNRLLLLRNRRLEIRVAERTRELRDQVSAKEAARAELAETQQRMIELSRFCGMAEIATGVLHNVGNVLNSVNVAATLAAGKTKELRVDNLVATIEMIQQHADDLNGFLAHDQKGRRVLPYLTKLGRHFQEERKTLLAELYRLQDHVEHIKQIVATQQNYSKVSGLIEGVCLAELVEDAFRMIQPGFGGHQIRFEREYEDLPLVLIDKHQVLQILLNLFRNAEQAIKEGNASDGMIRVRIRRHGEDRVRVEVKDSGVGLCGENLTRIFAHGFTTRRNGHGFGLHAGALAAQKMGGSLVAESEGLGLGATFILDLPLYGRGRRSKGTQEANVGAR